MLHKAWNSKGKMPYCFPRSSIKFQGHTGQNITDLDPNCAFPDYRPVAAFKSLRFALFEIIHQISRSHGLKNYWFESNLSKITRLVTAIKSLRFALLYPIHNKVVCMWFIGFTHLLSVHPYLSPCLLCGFIVTYFHKCYGSVYAPVTLIVLARWNQNLSCIATLFRSTAQWLCAMSRHQLLILPCLERMHFSIHLLKQFIRVSVIWRLQLL